MKSNKIHILIFLLLSNLCYSQPPGSIINWKKISYNNGLSSITAYQEFGFSSDTLGDLNNDGVMDIVVGAPISNNHFGQLYIIFMNSNKTVKSTKIIDQNTPNLNITSYSKLGTSVCNIGDFNHDGTNDLAVGLYTLNKVVIILLNSSGGVKNTIDIGGNFTGNFGISIANYGDIDHDGVVDLVVGGSKSGVYIIKLNANGSIKSSSLLINLISLGYSDSDDKLGNSVEVIGDLNGNGVKEIAVSGTGYYGRGEVFILFPNINYGLSSFSNFSLGNSAHEYDLFGQGLQYAGDINGDGIGDLYVGMRGDDNSEIDEPNYGSVRAIYLNAAGQSNGYYTISKTSGNFNNILPSKSYFGNSICVLGDINKDKIIDIMITAIGDNEGGEDGGAAYIFSINCLLNGVENIDSVIQSCTVYPNPSTGKLNIKTENITHILIYNLLGNQVYNSGPLHSEPNICINTSELKKGMYIIKIQTINTIFEQKIILN